MTYIHPIGKTAGCVKVAQNVRFLGGRGDPPLRKPVGATLCGNTVDLMPPAARGSFKKPPLDPVKLFIIKFFRLKSTTLTLCDRPSLQNTTLMHSCGKTADHYVNRRTARYLLLALVMLVFSTACGSRNGREIAAPGVVDGNIITLKAQAAGTIERFDLQEGDRVEKDTVIASIDSDKIENQLKEIEISLKEITVNREKTVKKSVLVRANLQYLRKQVERFRRLEKNNSVPGEQVENMELKLLEAETSAFDLAKTLESLDIQAERTQNKKEYLELLLKDHRIAAPVAGVIVEKFVSVGENVVPNSAVVDILDSAGLFVEVFIEEAEMASLKLNQRADILADGMKENEAIPGVIGYFGKKAEFSPKYIISEKERKALLYRVKIRIDRDHDILKIGMPVTVRFKRDGNAR